MTQAVDIVTLFKCVLHTFSLPAIVLLDIVNELKMFH